MDDNMSVRTPEMVFTCIERAFNQGKTLATQINDIFTYDPGELGAADIRETLEAANKLITHLNSMIAGYDEYEGMTETDAIS